MGAPIRKAASVVAVRHGDEAPEVLVLARAAGARFLPGYVAFPGGATDAQDASTAERWFGSVEEAGRACAVRELLEEVGFALTAGGLLAIGPGGAGAIEAAPPRAEQLSPIARWIAPEDVPVRFDAEYFAVEAPPGMPPEPDGREIGAAWWVSPAALLEEWGAGRRRLYWPTFFTMTALARCRTVEDLLAMRLETREPDEEELARLPRSVFWQE